MTELRLAKQYGVTNYKQYEYIGSECTSGTYHDRFMKHCDVVCSHKAQLRYEGAKILRPVTICDVTGPSIRKYDKSR